MAASLSLLGAGLVFGVGYAAGLTRPLRRLDETFDDAVRWAKRQLDRPQTDRRVQHWTASVIICTDVLLWVLVAPVKTLTTVRKIRARRAYSRQLPPEVTAAALAAVAAHRPRDAEQFSTLAVQVFRGGVHDLTNVVLLADDAPRTYLGLGNPKSSGLGDQVDPAALTRTTEALNTALTALRPPVGILIIPLKRG